MSRNQNLSIEVQVHSDGRGSKHYSRCYTCERAKAISNYLISKGISKDRLIATGYKSDVPITVYEKDSISGDTLSKYTLTNSYINKYKKLDNKKYEVLHQKNRRVQFKIVSTSFREINTVTLTLVDSILGKFDNFSVDNFGNIYTTKTDIINKYDRYTKFLFSASLKTIIPTSIESSKSFRILTFDKERGIVNFLDNTLTNVKGEIDLADLDVFQAALVCESFNGNSFWVLDQGGMQLLKFNQKLEVITRVENLNYLFLEDTNPVQMFEQNDELSIVFENKGIASFDVFGTYLKFTSLQTNWIAIKGQYIFHTNNQQKIEVVEKPLISTIAKLEVDQIKVKMFKIIDKNVYILSNKGLYIYDQNVLTNNKRP